MEQQASLTDWERIAMGDAPWIFLAELVVRSLVVYLLLLLFMRLMGKRVAAQLSATELAVILMLGAAIGLPIQVPENGLLPGVAVLSVILFCHRGLSYWTYRSRKVELVTHGSVIILVKEGRLMPEDMRRAYFSPDRLFAFLRAEGVEHLGEVRRVYLEAWGNLSLIRFRKPRPGLLILPPFDVPSGRYDVARGLTACAGCGNVVAADRPAEGCPICGSGDWREAVVAKSAGGDGG